MNWAALAISVGVAFFLSPFVVHRLGNTAYGVWTLVISMISYMSILDLGLRGAVTRYVARHHAQGDHSESSRTVSAALWLRVWIGVAVLLISLILAGIAPRLFRIPVELQPAAKWAIVVTGAGLAVTLTCGVFGGVLAALHRFDLLSLIAILQTLIRAAGVVWLLRSGYGIIALAVWEFAVILMSNTALVATCFRLYRELRIQFRFPPMATLRRLWGYSFYVLVINATVQVIYYTDNLIVGAFLSASAVTFYAIGGGLIEYLRMFVSSLAATFSPLASSFEAKGQEADLRRLLVWGTQAALLVALPIEVALFFRGPAFIGLWMGREYSTLSGQVLQILLVAQLFAVANATSGNIAYGLGKHRPVALWTSIEALANLALSVLLVRKIGLAGVAWGTAIASLATHLVFWPRHICKVLAMRVPSYLWQSWMRPALAALPFAIGCVWADRNWPASNLFSFFLQIAALLPFYAVGVGLMFAPEILRQVRSPDAWIGRRLQGIWGRCVQR